MPDYVGTLAKWFILLAVEAAQERGWEDYFPGVGVYDYERIMKRVDEIVERYEMPMSEFTEALEYFEGRAEE